MSWSKVKVARDKNGILALSAACVRFMFGKTSSASSYYLLHRRGFDLSCSLLLFGHYF